MAQPGAAAAANKAYFMQMKEKKPPVGLPTTGAPKDEKDLERERQREAEKARLKEEIRQLREKEEKEAKEKAEAEALKRAEEQRLQAEQEAAAPPPPTTTATTHTESPAPVRASREEASASGISHQMESASISDPVGVVRLRAIKDYEAAAPGELSYKKGDIVSAPPGTDTKAASCKGVLRGTAGTISLANTEDPSTGKRNGPPQARTGVRCRAVGNYTAQAPDELSFKQGDIIFVTVCTPQPIWTGVFKGQVGKFPRRLVVDESGDPDSFPPLAVTTPPKFIKYVCVKPHNAKGADELTITFGDVIQVLNDTGDDFLQGTCNGAHGRFPVDHTVNSAEFSKQQIIQMIELEKKKAPKGGWVTFDSAAAPATKAATADPFAPQPLSTTPRGSDPFAVSSDPFAPQPPCASRLSDPFAPQSFASPAAAFPSHPPHSGSGHAGVSSLPHHGSPLPLPLISAAAVQRALAESGPVLMTPPSPPRTRAHTGSRRERDTHIHLGSTPSSSAASGPASGQGSLTMIQAAPSSGGDDLVSTPMGPLSSS